MITNYDIVCLSSIDWDFIWQGHQEIMSSLAKQGNQVLFVENTGVRAPSFQDWPRLVKRFWNWMRATKGFRQEHENLFVYSPLLLPFPYSRLAKWVNRALLLRALRRWMDAVGSHRLIIWTFLPTPLVREVIHALHPELCVYYCIDDLASSSHAARRISRSESHLFREVDLVFVTSEKLRERAMQFTPRVSLFPFGVDFETFEQVRNSPPAIPDELLALPHPLVGYVGGIHQWVDQELVADVASRLPNVTFVFVGPCQVDVSRLRRCANVHFLGARSHQDVPRYLKGFDVGIVPYRATDYTTHVYPTKLNEYLAMGLPVIATDLPELRRFNSEHQDVVVVARNASEFITAIQAVRTQNSEEAVRRRIEVARRNSWGERVAQMSALMEEHLRVKQARVRQGWQESLLRLYRTARRRLLSVVLVASAVYLVGFRSPLVWLVAEPLRMNQPPHQADAIVVFAGGVGESGEAGQGHEERVKQAVELYREGYASRIIFSSGYIRVFHEAEVMKVLAQSLGVPPQVITLEERATNTYENVRYVTQILKQHGWSSILLVSSPYHMRRATLVLHRQAPDLQVIPTPVTSSSFYAHTWGATPHQMKGILQEYLAILWYWLKGWI